jgi:hypothetical protein
VWGQRWTVGIIIVANVLRVVPLDVSGVVRTGSRMVRTGSFTVLSWFAQVLARFLGSTVMFQPNYMLSGC